MDEDNSQERRNGHEDYERRPRHGRLHQRSYHNTSRSNNNRGRHRGRSSDQQEYLHSGHDEGLLHQNSSRGNNNRGRHRGRSSDQQEYLHGSHKRLPHTHQHSYHNDTSRSNTNRGRHRGRSNNHGSHMHANQHQDTTHFVQGASRGNNGSTLKHWQKCDIINLCRETSLNVVDRIQNEEEEFFNAFKYHKFLTDPSMLKYLIKILYMITDSHNNATQFACTHTSRVITDYSDFMLEFRRYIQLKLGNISDPFFHHILSIAIFCVNNIPSSTLLDFPHNDLQTAFEFLINFGKSNFQSPEVQIIQEQYMEYKEQYTIKFDEMRTQSLEQSRAKTNPRGHFDNYHSSFGAAANLHDNTSPDDFTKCDVLPNANEINDPKYEPFLRTNLLKSDYNDTKHYLDVQFRLLKEDFVGPLRDGIESVKNPKMQPDVAVYQRVRILEPVCLFSGIGFHIQFNLAVSRMEHIKWEHSRKLIYGSLLCLSKDDFKSILFASVVNRDPLDLKSGLLTVKFEGENSHRSAFNTSPKQEYKMIESSAYYEAYRHVLEGLQKIIPDQMPFQQYIVKNCPPAIPPPLYSRQNSMFDFNGVLELKNIAGIYQPRRHFEVNNPFSWPDASQTNLDESQLSALRASLSQEISIIQGPPGTGKTFIGLKIVDALLKNCDIWNPNNESPILVICYTNHALDQFLEGILDLRVCMKNDHLPNIVRIGGRCKSETLEKCVLANIVKSFKKDRLIPKGLAGHHRKVRGNMEKTKDDFEKIIRSLNVMEDKLLSFDDLDQQKIIGQQHCKQLTKKTNRDICIEVWLKLIKNPQVMSEPEPEDNEKPPNNENSSNEELIDVIDEPQLIEEDRLEEGDEEYEFAKQSNKRKKERKKTKLQARSDLQEDEWQVVQPSEKKRKKQIADGIKETPMTDEEVLKVKNVWKLPLKQRWQLYLNWLSEFVLLSKTDLSEIADEYNSFAKECMEVKEDIDYNIISAAHIIGMTTTGAAKNNYLLKRLHPKIVIVEEAAEVMESHIITSLCSEVQQVILIGDHKQLRPKPAYFKLEQNYNFNVSLFERLIDKDIPCVTLTTQHRMRPEIARIVGNHIYEKLEDAENVKKYENIKGVEKNLFFIEHNMKEDGGGYNDSQSHSNTYEATYITKLTKYLIQQGYKPDQITILTMYRGQLIQIKKLMPKQTFGGVRVAAVDDFQGEENDIIILSLVRSNPSKKIGFLKIENRICVALSRAKKGMFVIGDFRMLRDKSRTKWPNILKEMEQKGFLGDGLPLCCQNHPGDRILAKIPEDFSKRQEGGCQKHCNVRLQCGHACQSICHPVDMKHEGLYKCTKECGKRINCGHTCIRRCYLCTSKGCGPCKSKVEQKLSPCGHLAKILCGINPSEHKCTEKCDKTIEDCGHKCTKKCSEECTKSDKCALKCSAILNCSHKCQGTCGECNKGRLHIKCKEKCDRILNCGHACKFPCTPNCPPCNEKCRNYCFHGECPKKCYEPCVPCREPCKWECRHFKCTKACGEMCNRSPCNEPCRKVIKKCGHQCIGLCGEDCPSSCRICDKDEVTEIFFGTEDEENARFIQLKDCPHFIEVSSLDKHMNLSIDGSVEFKECPKCKTPIRRSYRYGNIVKNSILKMEEHKKKQLATTKKEYLLEKLQILNEECMDTPVLHQLVKNIMNRFAASKPHQSNTIFNQISMIKILLHLFECLSPNALLWFERLQIPHSKPLLVDAHRIIEFMNEPFLTSQQVLDIETETIRVYCLVQICYFKADLSNKGKILNESDDEELNSLAQLLAEMGWKKVEKPNQKMQRHVESRISELKQIYESS